MGIAAKPIAGTFDLISQTADGIKNTTTYFTESGARERVRPPRYIGEDKVLCAYNREKSEGKLVLQNLDDEAHQDETYLWHIEDQVKGSFPLHHHQHQHNIKKCLLISNAHGRRNASRAVGDEQELLLHQFARVEEVDLVLPPSWLGSLRGGAGRSSHLPLPLFLREPS